MIYLGTRKIALFQFSALRRITLLLFVLLFSASTVAFTVEKAYADVRKADVVVGKTVEDRGLSVSESPSITASSAALVSSDGTVYFSRNGNDQSQIASITKVMTAIVAIDNAPSNLTITVSAEAAEIGESTAGLQEGDSMNLEAALKALLVPSGNDAAISIAEAVGKTIAGNSLDPISVFVSAMNNKARDLGLADTLYENPHGLDDAEYAGDLHSTALDQAKVAQCAMSYPAIRDIVGGGSTTIQVKRGDTQVSIDLESTDLLFDMYDFAIGIKTGNTYLAGPSFMGAANKDGREMYAIVLGAADEYSRFQDAKNLFEWGYEHIVDLPLAQSENWTTMRTDGVSKDVPVIAEVPHCEWINRTVKATLSNPDAKVNIFDLEGNVSQDVQLQELNGTIAVGDKVGMITFFQNNSVIAEQDLVACERVESPNPLDTIAIWWQRLTQGLNDSSSHAPSRIYNVMPIIANNTSNAA